MPFPALKCISQNGSSLVLWEYPMEIHQQRRYLSVTRFALTLETFKKYNVVSLKDALKNTTIEFCSNSTNSSDSVERFEIISSCLRRYKREFKVKVFENL